MPHLSISAHPQLSIDMSQQESRVKKSLLNARVNLIFYFLTLALSFFSRKIFLDTLGADFVGLTTTLQNLLGFLNLAELGIGSAIGYVLYKPLFNQDEPKINEIISVFGFLYSRIGFIILGAGVVLGCFLPLIFPGTAFEMGIIYFAYASFLASSLIGYFANDKQTLLGADQKNYVVTAYFQTATIIKTLIQMASAYYTGSYYLWVAIELTFGIIYSFILNWKIRQVYPWLHSEIRQGRKLFKKYPEVMKKTKQLFVHKIASFAQIKMTQILTYEYVSLRTVACYGNYTIIMDKLGILVSNFLDSTGAGVGNLIAEGNKSKTINIFWELLAIRFITASTLSIALYHLTQPFIVLWVGDKFLLSNTALLLILLRFFFRIIRGATDQFIFGYGLFHDIWAPATETAIFIIVSVVGGYFIGLEGILLGGIISMFAIVGIWKPFFLFSKGFQISVWQYWKNWSCYLILCIIALIISEIIISLIFDSNDVFVNWKSWLVCGFVVTFMYGVICCLLFLLGTKAMRRFMHRFLH